MSEVLRATALVPRGGATPLAPAGGAPPPPLPWAPLDNAALTQLTTSISSDLGIRRWSLHFRDPRDEAQYRRYEWQRRRWDRTAGLALLAIFTLAFSLDYDLREYETHGLFLLIFFLGRVLPIGVLALLTCCPTPRVLRWWSPLAAGAVFLVALSLFLHQLLCSFIDDTASVSRQCVLLNAVAGPGLMPWLPVVVLVMAPVFMLQGLQCTWYDAAWACALTFGAFIGMILAIQENDFIATPVFVGVVGLSLPCWAACRAEGDARAGFRREVAAQRKVHSLVSSSVTRLVAQEQNQRLAELLKRIDACLVEVSREGFVWWVSPGSKALLGLEPEELLRLDFLRYVHEEDAPALRETLQALIASGAAIAAATPVPGTRIAPVPGASLPVEVVSHARLQLRLKHGEAAPPVWVEADMHPVIRRSHLIPGVSTATPPGETSVIMVMRDVTLERRKAAAAGRQPPSSAAVQIPQALTTSSTSLATGGTGDHSSSALAVVGSSGAAGPGPPLPGAATAPAPAAPPAPPCYDPFHERALYTAIAMLQAPLAAARVALAAACSSSLPAVLAAAATAAAAAASATPNPTAVAPNSNTTGTTVTTGTVGWAFTEGGGVGEGGEAHGSRGILVDERSPTPGTSSSSNSANHTAVLTTPRSPASAAAAAAAAFASASAAPVLKLASELRTADSYLQALQLGVVDALGVARYRAQFLPVRPTGGIDVRALAASAVEVARTRVLLVRLPPASSPVSSGPLGAAAASAVVISTSGGGGGGAGGAPTPSRVRISLFVDDNVPSNAMCDRARLQLLIEMILALAVTAAAAGEVSLSVRALVHRGAEGGGSAAPVVGAAGGGGGGSPQDAALRISVSFDASAVGGVEAVANALAADPLASDQMFSPVPRGSVEPPDRAYAAMTASDEHGSRGALSFVTLLPLLRHTVLCMSGVITAGTGTGTGREAAPLEPSPGVDPNVALLVVDIPLRSTHRVLAAGPTCEDPAVARARIARSPLDFIPLSGGSGAGPRVAAALAAAAAAPGGAASVPRGPGVGPGGGAPAATPALVTQGLHILFVDDEPVNRKLGARMLQRLGCSYELLEDGDLVMGALEQTQRPPFDALLIDIVMQRSDGAVVCQELREAGVDLPIVAMTGNTSVRDVQRFMAAGFDLVLPKPFDIRAMGRAIVEARARRARLNATLAPTR